jgi:hypothetical protein
MAAREVSGAPILYRHQKLRNSPDFLKNFLPKTECGRHGGQSVPLDFARRLAYIKKKHLAVSIKIHFNKNSTWKIKNHGDGSNCREIAG